MKTFNAYGQTSRQFGGNEPVWCGVVRPIPVGGVLDAEFVKSNALYRAGTPVEYDESTRTFKPLVNPQDAVASEGAEAKVKVNGYLYNDIYIGPMEEENKNFSATGAIVMNHPDGLLIDRTGFSEIKETLRKLIPGVHLITELAE